MTINLLYLTFRAVLAIFITSASAYGIVFTVPKASLSAPALDANSIVHFDEIPLNLAINGQTIKGFTFLENTPVTLTSLSGPGIANNLTAPWATNTSLFNPASYVLTIQMPAVVSSFGFGFAVNSSAPVPNAVTVTLFNGINNVGSLSYDGALDPEFAGGFAGIGSSVGFTSAQVSFSSASNGMFAIDNIAVVVPEPGTVLAGLFVAGVCVATGFRPLRRCARPLRS